MVNLLQSEPLFFLSASISTLLFLGSFVLILLGGDHGGSAGSHLGDVSAGMDLPDASGSIDLPDASPSADLGNGSAGHGSSDAHHVDSVSSFKIFTVQSVLAFFMGFGWVGLASRLEWKLGYFLSTTFSILFGAALLFFTAFLMSRVYRLNAIRSRDLYEALGDEAKVYLTIPENGRGKIQAVVDGSLRIMDAVSRSGRIEQFKEVEIVGVEDQSTFIVREK